MILTGIEQDSELGLLKAEMLGSFLRFIQVFFRLYTGREFVITEPINRESHVITLCKELTKIFRLETNRLLINIPPGHGKSTIISYFIAWAFAHYPDCQFLYISYSHDLAAKHTSTIKSIMMLPAYKTFFGVSIRHDSSAKDDFKTTGGGAVKAFGSSGGITGQDAGLPNLDRFSGGVFLDDMHKPDEVHSDTIRDGVIRNYNQTIKPRPRAPNVPIVGIGQMLHEGDIFGFLKSGQDGQNWRKVVLKAIDEAGNILAPSLTPREMLLREQEFNPYVFSAQYQQDPQPAGGGIFKPENFVRLDNEPNNILSTFITVDTAETDKNYNDATVFSFWGLYNIEHLSRPTNLYALHWIDCIEIRVEPCDLESEFITFYSRCCQYKVRPSFVGIEKKSTGVTLSSILKNVRGLVIRDIDRTKASGNKTSRYMEAQPYQAEKRISLPSRAPHTEMCINHCKKITANNSHLHDDICDTMYDAIKIALIDQTLIGQLGPKAENQALNKIMTNFRKINKASTQLWK